MARTFTAKYPGFCPECRDDIAQGDEVTYSDEDKVIHAECSDDAQAVAKIRKEPAICLKCNMQKPCDCEGATFQRSNGWNKDGRPPEIAAPTPEQSAARLAAFTQNAPPPAPIPTGQAAIDAFFAEVQPISYVTMEQEVEAKVPRDRHDRPLILQPDGGTEPYNRASSYGGQLDDKTNVEKWDRRQVVRGIAIALRGGKAPNFLDDIPERLFDPWQDQDGDQGDKKLLDSLAERAKDMAGSNLKSQLGTDIHFATEIIDAGDSLEDKLVGFEPWRKDLLIERANAYHRYTSELGLKWDSIEVFGVQDELMVAGTWDRRGYVPWWPEHKQTIGDVKTSSSMDFAGLTFSVQLATYSRMCEYVIETGERIPHEDMNLDKAIIIHVDRMKNGPVEAFEVDIAWGWSKAVYAREIIVARREGSTKGKDRKVQRIDERRVAILSCTTKGELADMASVVKKWPQHLIDLAKARYAAVPA